MRGVWLLALVGCGSSSPPVPAWTSGTRIRAQVFTGDDLVALAGRIDTATGWTCPVDETATPNFANCPRQVWLQWRDTDCVERDIAIWDVLTDDIVMADVDGGIHYYRLGEPYTQFTTNRDDATGKCTIPTSSPMQRVATEIPGDDLELGTMTTRAVDGVHYVTLDTADGFSVVTYIEGGNEVIEGTGRIRARYRERGPVRMFAGLFDSDLGVNCFAAEAGDGTLRCVPEGIHGAWGCTYDCDIDGVSCSPDTGLHAEIALGNHTTSRWPAIADDVRQCVPATRPVFSGRQASCLSVPNECTQTVPQPFAALTIATE